jgi:hypothetical protein
MPQVYAPLHRPAPPSQAGDDDPYDAYDEPFTPPTHREVVAMKKTGHA